jgi:hypothetical protein
MLEKVVRVTKNEFELEDGTVHQIIPPLEEAMAPEEFQEHYDRAINIIQSIKNFRSDNQDAQKLG